MKAYISSLAKNPTLEVLAGLTVALALVPEAIAFAFVAGVDPLIGLSAAVIMAFVTALIGGRPGMISGATGATAVVMTPLVASHGVEYLFAAIIVTGILQVAFGLLKWGKFARLIPLPVMIGFVNGLAIVIGLAQLGNFRNPDGSLLPWPQLLPTLSVVGLVMFIMWGFPKLGKVGKNIPGGLVAIVSATLLVVFAGLDVKSVGDITEFAGTLPGFSFPEVPFSWEVLRTVFPYSAVIAGVGIIESLMTLMLVDEITETRGRPNREAIAQGAANTLSGFLGAMGGCAMIGQTMINIGSGARGRLSGLSAGAFLLIFILFLGGLIEMIPLAALVGVMFMVVIGTFEWSTFKMLRRIPKNDVLVIVAVTVITLLTDLALAVLAGVIISALNFAWQSAKRIRIEEVNENESRKVYYLRGYVFFGSIYNFKNLFDIQNDHAEVVIDFASSKVYDHSGVDAIHQLSEKYKQAGKKLSLRHLSEDCALLLAMAGDLVEVNLVEDPRYRLADDALD